MRKICFFIILIFNLAFESQAEVKLTFGVYTSDKPSRMVTKFKPILKQIEQNMSDYLQEDIVISMQVYATYEKGIEAITTGKVDFMRLGPASYVFAKENEPGLSILAMENQKGKKTFKGIICTHQDSQLHTIKDLKGKSFAFGNKKSTIGRYLSQNHMMSHDIYARDLAKLAYLGRHDTVGMSVSARKYDAGALKEGTFNKLIAQGHKLRKIADFDNVTKPWVSRKLLDNKIYQTLQSALLNITDPDLLKAYGKQGFLMGNDQDYQPIRRAIAQNIHFSNHIIRTSSK
ncbi:MAG: PhnD/SsuA/transferrin family substrate-binding protein [Emcibacter sp.]|nr:PhnD/SsuA/transferrin family substrate-binding protein [Emcibacter sp.]